MNDIWPSDWKKRPEFVAMRIYRLERALPYCKGRAADVRPLVEQEIRSLKNMAKETTVIATWKTLADSLSRAADIARPDSVPIGTCTTENIATEQAPIIRMVITVDLIPR